MTNWQNIKDDLVKFLKNEALKAKFHKTVVGLSGGLDSAIVAVLCKEAFNNNLKVVLLPSSNSSKSSTIDAISLCKKFDIDYEIIEISPIVDAYLPNMQNNKLRVGNFCARARMSILYDISARDCSLVIGTSNKSERLLGYGTIFGDLACAINPIGEIYKSDLYDFAKFLGITQEIIDKKPSADLWEGQSDEDDLGYSYKELDGVMKFLIDDNISQEKIVQRGFSKEILQVVQDKVEKNRFKGSLPTIAKINWSNQNEKYTVL